MDFKELLDISLSFINRWAGTTVPRIFSAFLGMLFCILSAIAVWDRRLKLSGGLFVILFGGLMVAAALDPKILYIIAQTEYYTRIRMLMIVLSVVVMLITIESIRQSHLQEQYALLWIATSLIILVTAFFPNLLNFFKDILGTQYVTSVVGIIFTFLLLIAFHFSISLSRYRKNQTKITQQYALLEERIVDLNRRLQDRNIESQDDIPLPPEQVAASILTEASAIQENQNLHVRPVRGAQVANIVIIAVMVIAVLVTGFLTPQPMVGDEITHYYMLTKQADNLSKPNFLADIPTGWGVNEVRRYPHTFLWHYIGAVIYLISGKSFFGVQLYQCLFLGQLLVVAHLLAKSRGGIENRSATLFIILIASLPVSILFSVTFYQDVPMTAQALSAFYFLRKRRYLLASLFMCFGIGLKETGLLFLPAFFILLVVWEIKSKNWFRSVVRILCAVVIISCFTLTLGHLVKTYADSLFYPEAKFYEMMSSIKHTSFFNKTAEKQQKPASGKLTTGPKKVKPVTPYEVEIIANHPGDLRRPENLFIYGGMIMWVVLLMACVSFAISRFKKRKSYLTGESSVWLWLVGGSYILITAYLLRTAPDARFFLPGLPFILLPLSEYSVRLPRPKLFIAVIAALSILQAGFVFAKTFKLRHLTYDTRQAIEYLSKNPPNPPLVFMYPEGNYRMFPVRHQWYLKYRLREFWKTDNDQRIKMLQNFRIGAIVIKKYLVAKVGPDIINLGVYPDYFVKDIEGDSRFIKEFENNDIAIYKVPPKSHKRITIQK